MKYFLILTITCALFFSCNSKPGAETDTPAIENPRPEIPKNISSDTLKAVEETVIAKTDTPVPAIQKAVKKKTGNTRGKVSHQFRKSGCATVIIVKGNNGEEELVLIPKDALKKEIDIDGMIIYFNYHPLKMRNPPGCVTGMPAEITDAEAE